VIHIPNPGAGDLVGRVRLSDNNSAMPQDRIFVDYNYLHNVPLTASGVDVNRFTPGFEKTFRCGLAGLSSVEMRIPMAATLDSHIYSDAPNSLRSGEFGNINVAVKTLLYETGSVAFAAGLGVSLPTAADVRVSLANGTPLVRVSNDAVHLTPYLAGLYRSDDTFGHAFLQWDVATNGNPIAANLDGSGLTTIGDCNDQAFMFVDVGVGRWIRRTSFGGVAVTAELHSSTAISDADSVQAGGFVIGDPHASIDLLNCTVGAHLQRGKTTFTVGYNVPLTSDDRVFDGEARGFVNRHY